MVHGGLIWRGFQDGERVSAAEKPVLSMREAVSRYVPDGQELLIGGFAFSDPTALAHELIRQRRRDLFVMKTSGGVLVDQLVGAGCVKRVLSCHVWNSVRPVAAHCFRRALEQEKPHAIEIEELSYGAFTMALMAGACDLPFMPTTPVHGAGHFTQRSTMPNKFGVVENPLAEGPCASCRRSSPLSAFSTCIGSMRTATRSFSARRVSSDTRWRRAASSS